MKWTLIAAVAMLVTACDRPGGNSCAGWWPIELAEQSIAGLTDQDAQEILAHNNQGRRICGW